MTLPLRWRNVPVLHVGTPGIGRTPLVPPVTPRNQALARQARRMSPPTTPYLATPATPAAAATTILKPQRTAAAIAVVCYIGLVANKAAAERLGLGRQLDISESTASPWQFVREAVIILLLAALTRSVIRSKRAAGGTTISTWTLFIAVFLALSTVAALIRADIPAAAVFTGLRFIYVALLALAIGHYSRTERQLLLTTLARWLMPFLAIEAWVALQQVLHGPATLGTTQLGARPWGTYASANNLGLAMLGILIVVMMARIRMRWHAVLVIGTLCLATGSRTAVLGFALACSGALVSHWRRRLVAVPFAVVGVYALYGWASSPAVSGRAGAGGQRFGTWAIAAESLDGTDWAFGNGIGVGTNSLVALVGTSNLSAAAISDSAFIAATLSLGLAGLALYLWAYLKLWRMVDYGHRFTILPMLGLALLTFNVLEVSPFNVLVAVAIGCSLPVPDESKVAMLRDGTTPRVPSTPTSMAHARLGGSGWNVGQGGAADQDRERPS